MGSGVYDSDTLVLATDQAMGADFTTPWHETKYHDMGAMQLWWSGADATNVSVCVNIFCFKII